MPGAPAVNMLSARSRRSASLGGQGGARCEGPGSPGDGRAKSGPRQTPEDRLLPGVCAGHDGRYPVCDGLRQDQPGPARDRRRAARSRRSTSGHRHRGPPAAEPVAAARSFVDGGLGRPCRGNVCFADAFAEHPVGPGLVGQHEGVVRTGLRRTWTCERVRTARGVADGEVVRVLDCGRQHDRIHGSEEGECAEPEEDGDAGECALLAAAPSAQPNPQTSATTAPARGMRVMSFSALELHDQHPRDEGQGARSVPSGSRIVRSVRGCDRRS